MAEPIVIPAGAVTYGAPTAAPAASAAAAPPKEPLFPEPLIAVKNFTDWSQACRVRQIADRKNEMLENAADENLTLDQYLKKNNMQDQTAFLLTCPQFDLTCWPSALAELGSGFVLYFHFLIFLGCFLFVSFIVQMPAVMEYWDEDNFAAWSTRAGKNETDMLSGFFIYTSPGMLGPRRSELVDVPLCYFALVVILCAAVVAHSAWQIRVDSVVDEGTTQPNDFAIMVEGLPATATDEEAILNFFKAHAVRDKAETEIVKVVIGWDAKEYREKMRKIRVLKKELKDLPPDDPKVKDIQEAMKEINAQLVSAAPDVAARLMSSGVAVISFRYQTDLRRCLDRWQSLWATWAYRDWGNWCGLCGGPVLPRFPTATGVGVWKIKVSRAPNPGDINWDDLGVPRNERLQKLAVTNGFMLLCILISFGVCFTMVKIKEDFNSVWASFLPVFGIAFASSAVQWTAKYWGEKEYHDTVTGQNGSQALKMTIGMIVNKAVVLPCIYTKDYEWYKKSGLVADILMLIGVVAVMQPLFHLLDLKYSLFGRYKRNKLDPGQINRLKEGAEWYNANGVTKETLDKFKSFKAEYQRTVAYFMTAFEPSEMDMKKRYAIAVRTFVCCMCYCHLVPFVSLLGIMGIVAQYWVDKKMLLRWYKRPAIPQGLSQARMSLFFLRFTTLLMPLCMWFFIGPSYKHQSDILYWMAFSYAPAAFLCVLPLNFIRTVLCAPCRGRNRARVASDATEDYYTAQYMWPRDLKYHKSHSLYAGLPEAKNPEFLDENTSAVTKADDVKASYGASAKDAAVKAEGPGAGASARGPSPDLGAGGDAPILVTSVSAGSSTPVAAPVTATLLPADAGDTGGGRGGGGGGGPIWEMEIGRGWSNFDNDCQEYMEKQYQRFKSGGSSRTTVRTKDMTLSVDFEKMTQMRKGKGHAKVHKIRRSEGP